MSVLWIKLQEWFHELYEQINDFCVCYSKNDIVSFKLTCFFLWHIFSAFLKSVTFHAYVYILIFIQAWTKQKFVSPSPQKSRRI